MATVVEIKRAQTDSSSSHSEPKFGSSKEANDVIVQPVPSGLGVPLKQKRFWWQRGLKQDPSSIATLPSVYDDPDLAPQYQPRSDWENIHRFDPSARWTCGEERKLVRKIDLLIMAWACIMFVGLELDRANIGQALSDNLLPELGMTTNDYNLGNTVFALSFLCAELPSQLVSKWLGPDRWVPAQLVLWSVVASSQFFLSSRASFLACRSLLGLLQGGFIPDIILYLSYFYKHSELTVRLGFFWTAMTVADIVTSLLAYGLLHLRGVLGYSGWRWLFLVEGLVTLVIGLASFILMPPGPCQTANWSRGKKGWFTPREETIMVNRIIRDDPSKGDMHNRQRITFSLLIKSILDFDLWPIYVMGLLHLIPTITPQYYLTLSLRSLGFDTFTTNLLVIPSQVLKIITMLSLSYFAERTGQLSAFAAVPQLWALPFLIFLRVVNTTAVSKWLVWAMMTVLIGAPLSHPIQVAWVSRNSNTVRSRTTGSAFYNMAVQTSTIVAANIYRTDDAPLYRRGNSVLIGIAVANLGVYAAAKAYYVWRNRVRDRRWADMGDGERKEYLIANPDGGNKRLDFRFAH